MKKNLLQDLLPEGIRSRLAQTTGKQRTQGALQAIAKILARAEDRGYYANLLMLNFSNAFETLGRAWHHEFSRPLQFERLFHKLGILQEDQAEMQRAMGFLLKQYNANHRAGYDDDGAILDKWWSPLYNQLDDLYMLYKIDADEEDIKDYLRDKPRVTEGIVARTSQYENRTNEAIDIISKALIASGPGIRSSDHRSPHQQMTDKLATFEQMVLDLADWSFHDQPYRADAGIISTQTKVDNFFKVEFQIDRKDKPQFKKAVTYLAQQSGKSSSLSRPEPMALYGILDEITARVRKEWKASEIAEGIVSRTSQHGNHIEQALELIAKALADNYDFDPKTKQMSPRSGEMIDRAHEWLTHYINVEMEARADAAMKANDEDMEDDQWERDKSIKTKSQLAKEFGIKPQYVDPFFRAFLYVAHEYVFRTPLEVGRASDEEDDANEWYEETIHALEKKYEAYRSR